MPVVRRAGVSPATSLIIRRFIRNLRKPRPERANGVNPI